MRSERFDVDYGGPALVQATATGSLIHPQQGNRLASFVQRYRLWTGRPILEIEVTLADLDPAWLEQAAQADPWSVYLACRWAWPDPNSMLRRTVFWSPELTEAERPETPDALDISTRTQRTALLFGGLPYHRKHGSRMLDTLLVAGMESTRSFTLGAVLDLEHPFHAAQDLLTPALVVPIEDGPPSIGASGLAGAGRPQGRGRFARRVCRPRRATAAAGAWFSTCSKRPGMRPGAGCGCFVTRSWARQADFLGETIVDLSIDGDAVSIDLTPHELARVEVTFG